VRIRISPAPYSLRVGLRVSCFIALYNDSWTSRHRAAVRTLHPASFTNTSECSPSLFRLRALSISRRLGPPPARESASEKSPPA